MRTKRQMIKKNCKTYVRNELKCKPNSISSPLTTTTPPNSASATTHSRRMSISCCTCCKSSSRTTRRRRQEGSLKGKDSPLRSTTLHTHTHTHQHAPHLQGTSVGGDDGRGASAHGEQAAVANTAAATLGHVTSPADTLTRTHIHTQRRKEGAQEGAERARARALARALRQQKICCNT